MAEDRETLTVFERYVHIALVTLFVVLFVVTRLGTGFAAYLDHLCYTYRDC